MRLLLPFILILLIFFRMKLKKSDKSQEQRDRMFWERESKADSVRKKDIEQLHYITIPENLPPIDTDNSDILNLLEQLDSMKGLKILNLTGLSNTDLKMEYGVANLAVLSECDDNFTQLARILSSLGHKLMENGFTKEAIEYLKFGIDCNTDITANYVDLATLYKENNQPEMIDVLLSNADSINSLSKEIITKKLRAIK